MALLSEFVAINGSIVPAAEATMSVASSAVLYGLSVYSVMFAKHTSGGMLLFRAPEHLTRLKHSALMIGMDSVTQWTDFAAVTTTIKSLFEANQPTSDQFIRMTIHGSALIPGIKTKDLELTMSIFLYDANNILPQDHAHIKTSQWRRVADTAIPARAKVNGAYVNSALAKQEAIDNGFDDALLLNQNGYVSELSAANIFMVKNGTLITPDPASDILEGITRRSIIEIAAKANIEVVERKIALTELYTADEVFACGTSAFVSPITTLDNRSIGDGTPGTITTTLRKTLQSIQADPAHSWTTLL
jgi:branched-chain amino acid aminotransferase